MRGLQDWQSLLTRHCTFALVRVRNEDAKCTLSKSLPDRDDAPLYRRRGFSTSGFPCKAVPLQHRFPSLSTDNRLKVIGLTLNDVRAKVDGGWDPIALAEKEWLLQDDASDRVLRTWVHHRVPVPCDPAAHLRI